MSTPPRQALLDELALRSTHDPHDRLVRLAVRTRAGDACEYCLLPTVGQFHDYLFVTGFTTVGRATEAALRFNDARLGGPLGTRHEHIVAGRYPPEWARGWLASATPGKALARSTRRGLT